MFYPLTPTLPPPAILVSALPLVLLVDLAHLVLLLRRDPLHRRPHLARLPLQLQQLTLHPELRVRPDRNLNKILITMFDLDSQSWF